MKDAVDSTRVGTIEFREDELIHFPGLPGFPDAKRFFVREHDRDAHFAWLISADRGDLAFVVVDPWTFVPDYRPVLQLRDLEALGVRDQNELQLLTIARPGSDALTVNLAAPLLVSVERRLGRQAILEQGNYGSRHVVPFERAQIESKPHK